MIDSNNFTDFIKNYFKHCKNQGWKKFFAFFLLRFAVYLVPVLLAIPKVSDIVSQNGWYIVFFFIFNLILFILMEYVSTKKIFDEEEKIIEKYEQDIEDIEKSHNIDSKNAEVEIISLNDEIEEKQDQIINLELKLQSSIKKHDELTETIEMYSGIIDSNIQKFIFQLFKSLELGHHDRISLYRRDEIKSDFVILTRHSKNEEFKKQARQTYPHDEGFISKCWGSEPIFYIDSMDKFPNVEDQDGFNAYFKKYYSNQGIKFNPDVLRNISMKSRSFYVRNIYDESQEKTFGVLVIESIDPKIGNFSSEEEITKRLDDDPLIMPYLYYLMNNNLN